jgi:RNA polymerase sigma factor FliA
MLTEDRNRLVVENLPLVGYLVTDLCSRATHLSRDDLASAGALALVTAAEAYDPDMGVPFGAYARRRIVGAFADELRSNDWASRGTRKRIRETLAAEETLTSALGRTPTHTELADAMGVDTEVAREARSDASRVVGSIDETMHDRIAAEAPAVEDGILGAEQGVFVRAAVDALPERMRLVVTRIYFEERTVGEVAEELGITHSAVSQQRSEAIRLLRDGFAAHYAERDDRAGEPDEYESTVAPARRSAYLSRVADYASAGFAELRAPASPGIRGLIAG